MHKAYRNQLLRHHHVGQGRYAYAIPEKVHQKGNSILLCPLPGQKKAPG